MRQWFSEQLAAPGLYTSLVTLDADPRGWVDQDELAQQVTSAGVHDPLPTLREMEGLGLLNRSGATVGLSTLGVKTTLLLRALNGGDIQKAFHRLQQLDGSLTRYSLVREGMTTGFFKSLVANPDIGKLYVCSPWINLSRDESRYLATAILRRRRKGEVPDVLVITRPDDGYGTRTENLKPFIDIGAQVFLHSKLHAKLYVREPGSEGGYTLAVIGSQNLTRSKYLELGIRIEADSILITKLIRYFFRISHQSDELET